jgi:hypothetical protein
MDIFFIQNSSFGEVSSPEFFSQNSRQNSLLRRTFDENKSSERGAISTKARHEREGIRLNERKRKENEPYLLYLTRINHSI